MKGLFIPEITAEMFRNGCLEGIEALMAEGEIYDIDYETERKKGHYVGEADAVEVVRCDQCRHFDAINNDDHGWCKRISDLPIGPSVRYHDDYCSYGERAEE